MTGKLNMLILCNRRKLLFVANRDSLSMSAKNIHFRDRVFYDTGRGCGYKQHLRITVTPVFQHKPEFYLCIFRRVPEFCYGRFNFASVFSRKHKFCLERFNLYLGTFSRECQFCLDNLNSPSKLPWVSNLYDTPYSIKFLLH